MRWHFPRAAFAACCLIFPLAALPAAATADALSLEQAIGRALAQRPELAGFEIETRIREAQGAAAAQRPPLQIDAGIEDALGTGEHSGLDRAETTLALSQIIELGGKRDGRVEVAGVQRERLLTDRAIGQLDVIAEVARRFIGVLREQARHELAQEGVVIAEATLQRVEERVRAARAPPAESARAGVQLWDARLILEATEYELDIARRHLAAAMGESSSGFRAAEGDLLALPANAPLEELLARLEAAPDLRQFADEERLRAAQFRLAEMQQRSDLRLTLGLRHYQAGDDVALVAGVSLPLFTGRRAQPQIDAARAQRERISVDRQAAYLKLQAGLHSQYLQMEHERELSRILLAELLPRLEQAQEQTAFAYERGRYSYLEWATSQRELLEGRRRLIESVANFHLLRTEIERLTGQSLGTAGATP